MGQKRWKVTLFVLIIFLISACTQQTKTSEKSAPSPNKIVEEPAFVKEEKLENNSLTEIVSYDASKLNVTLDGRPTLGRKNAFITIIAFVDTTYPYYSHFLNDVLPQLKERYLNKGGEAQLIFKNYVHLTKPSNILAKDIDDFFLTESYQHYIKLAVVADCANRLDPELFIKTQQVINKGFNDISFTVQMEELVKQLYPELDISYKDFNILKKCALFNYNEERENIKQDFEEGRELELKQTTFFINDEKIEGIQDFMVFDKIIKKKLEGIQPPECFSYNDCSENRPHCISEGVCSAVQCNVDEDCDYFNQFGYQHCVEICGNEYDSFTGRKLCLNNVCQCVCQS